MCGRQVRRVEDEKRAENGRRKRLWGGKLDVRSGFWEARSEVCCSLNGVIQDLAT